MAALLEHYRNQDISTCIAAPIMVDPKLAAFPRHTGIAFTETSYHAPPPTLDPSSVQLRSPCVVCITGAGRGLGEAYAVAFAKAGATALILASRTEDELIKVAETVAAINSAIKISVQPCDVTDEDSVLALAAHITETYGRLDVLINNAGFLDAGWQPITQGPADEWRQVLDVNVYGVYLVTRNLLDLLLNSDSGLKTVISITSMSSHFAGPSIAMGISKLGLNRLMEFLDAQYQQQGLKTFSLMPGGVKTAMSTSSKVPSAMSESKSCCALEWPFTINIIDI